MAERKALVFRSSDNQIEELPSGDTLTGASGGSGVPNGGTLGQVLTKNSATDGDADWADPTDIVGAFKGFRVTKTTSVAAGVGMTMETTEIDSESGWSTSVYTVPASLNGMYMNFSAGLVVNSGTTVGVYIERSTDSGSNWTIIAHQASTLTVNAVDSGPILVATGEQFRISGYGGNTTANELRNFFSGHVIHGVGAQGSTGLPGTDGTDGQGVPTGGTAGQILSKLDATDYNTEWIDAPTGDTATIVARYWRLNSIYALNPLDDPSAVEIEFRDTVGGSKLAGTVSASTEFSGSYTAAMANDGNTGTLWASTASNAWFEIDLGDGNDATVREIMFTARNDGNENQTPTNWALEYSDDGLVWTQATTNVDASAWTSGEVRTYDVSADTDGGAISIPALSGNAGKVLTVNNAENDVEWTEVSSGGTPTSAISARYWRFNEISTSGHTTLQPSEMILKDIDGVQFTPSTGSTSLVNGIANLYDEDTSTNSYQNSHDGTDYVEYDFGADITPIYVSVSSPSFFSDGPRAPTDWTLQYSDDGTNWTDLTTLVGGSNFGADEERLYEIEENKPAITSAVTAYTNTGGQGNRQSIITTWQLNAVNVDPLIDGSYANANYWGTADAAGKIMGVDFGVGNRKGIDEITFYQSNSATHGVWKIQATNNDIDWTDISSEFTLGGSTSHVITCDLFDGTPYYKFRFLGVSGTTSISPYLQEIDFKIADYVPILPNELPAGGGVGEVLVKTTASNYDTEWVPATWKINRRTETASFTLTDADFAGGVYIECDHATVAIEITIPASLTGTEPVVIERTGAASVTLIHAAVTLNSRDSLVAIGNQHSSITIVPKGSDVFNAQGDLG